MPQILKSNFEIFIAKWLPQKKDVKNLELWILISWDGAMVDYFMIAMPGLSFIFYAGIPLNRQVLKRERLNGSEKS